MLLDRCYRSTCSNVITPISPYIEESAIVAIRPPKYNSQGYTLLEMLAVLGMVAVVVGFATPSFLALNKPLRNGTSQFVSQLSLIRSKAISGNQAYRLRPKYPLAFRATLSLNLPQIVESQYLAVLMVGNKHLNST
jgi:prepilin-type N-terminal cleavage/methylation domain-containing protein